MLKLLIYLWLTFLWFISWMSHSKRFENRFQILTTNEIYRRWNYREALSPLFAINRNYTHMCSESELRSKFGRSRRLEVPEGKEKWPEQNKGKCHSCWRARNLRRNICQTQRWQLYQERSGRTSRISNRCPARNQGSRTSLQRIKRSFLRGRNGRGRTKND